MLRILKLVVLPWLAGLLVGVGLGWWLTPRPREMDIAKGRRYVVELSADGTLAHLAEQPGDNPYCLLCDTQSCQVIARFGSKECQGGRLTPDGRMILWMGGGDSDFVIRSYDPILQSSTELLRRVTGKVKFLECAADARTFAWLTDEEPSRIEVWDIRSAPRGLSIPIDCNVQFGFKPFSLAPDGSLLATLVGFAEAPDKELPKMSMILCDLSTGAVCDRLPLPQGIAWFPSFERDGRVVRMMEHRLSHFSSDPATGRRIPWMIFVSGEKHFDLTAGDRLGTPRMLLGLDPSSSIAVVRGAAPETAEIQDCHGRVLSRTMSLSSHDSFVGPRLIPGTTLLVANEECTVTYPQWALFVLNKLCLSLTSGKRHEYAVLVDWRTGQRKVLRSKPDFYAGAGRSVLSGYLVAVSTNGEVMCLTYETEEGCHAEFWDAHRLRRPWWLITLAALLATSFTLVLLTWLQRRRGKLLQRALIRPVAT